MKGFAFVNIVIVSFLVLFVSISPAMSEHSDPQSGPTIYVATTGSDETGDGSEEYPYKTIQKGIDMAINGDTVQVAVGTYTGTGNVNLDFKGKAITVTSEDGAASCTIDCQGVADTRGFYFHNGEGEDSVLDGFTIRDGNYTAPGPDYNGGGIYCESDSSPTIINNIITENWASFGGGIYCMSNAVIENNIITGNHAWYNSGGMFCGSNATVIGNVISGNHATYAGGVYCMASSPMMVNNVITGNTCAEAGGGITCDHASPTVINNTIVGNSASPDGMTAPPVGGISCRYNSSPTLINTILWSNSPTEILVGDSSTIDITYSDIQDGWPGDGNINVEPLFVDAANDDYHLDDYSLCIGAGTSVGAPSTDIEGNPRGTPPDMGAYENSLNARLTTIYVATTGDDFAGNGSASNPYRTIYKGIDMAINGDTVQVADGTYTGAGNVNLDFKGKVITVRSENGPEACAVDCQGISGNRGFYFHSGEGPDSILEGFTIRNGWFDKFSPPPSFGAGILCSNGSSPTIKENIITGNWEGNLYWGGGIYCDDDCSPRIINNVISSNSAWGAAGIYCGANSNAEIRGNIIKDNHGENGGGIYCSYDSSPLIVGNIITGNATKTRTTAGQGGAGISCHGASPEIVNNVIAGNRLLMPGSHDVAGGIYCWNSSPNIVNNTITGNSADFWFDGVYYKVGVGGIYCLGTSSPTITNTIVWGNSPGEIVGTAVVTHSDVQGGWPGTGNIDADPLFVDAEYGNYHLSDSSPCIGAGTEDGMPDEDIEHNPRPNPESSNPDIGAYENQHAEPLVAVVIKVTCPVDLVITDPMGNTISKGDTSAIPSATYTEEDLNGDGDPDDMVTIGEPLLGNYLIEVQAEPDANPTDTYTLVVICREESTTLADHVAVQDIPVEPYVFFYPHYYMMSGWHLISLPLEPTDPDPGAVLSSLDDNYSSVWAYDPEYGWSIYASGMPSNLSEMETGSGYWVKMDRPGTLTIEGMEPSETGVLLRGGAWNLVGYSCCEYRDPAICMSQVADKINSVWEYDLETGWAIYAPGGVGDLAFMKTGYGYWIKADQVCTWDVNAAMPAAAPPLALRSRSNGVSTDRPEMPYVIWGSVETDGVRMTSENDCTVVLKLNNREQLSYRLGAADGYGNSYMLGVPVDDGFSQVELYVCVDDRMTKAIPVPPGEPGQIVRFDLSVQLPPKVSMLSQNYPNPFNPDTWIPYQLKEDALVVIRIYAATGQLVRILSLGHKPAGFYMDKKEAAYWDGRNEVGEPVASGIYFYSIQAGDLATTKKMVIAR